MVGGIVIEVAEVRDRPDVLFVDCRETNPKYRDTCAIYVEKNETSMCIEPGDSLWWQGRWAMWTPQANRRSEEGKCGRDYDIKIPRVGYSGVQHPARA